MISPNELRIGNWITETFKYGIGIDTQIRSGAHLDELASHECFYPIPLTEEWLLKFGFKRLGLSIRFSIDKNREFCLFDQEDIFRYQTRVSGWTTQMPHIKHVHQLQNLYFALMNKELKDERSVATGDD